MYSTKNVVERITLEEILKRTTEYDIYRYYIGENFKIGHIMSSPLRTDTNPSFGIFKSSKTGELLFKDHATGESGNCIKFLMLLYETRGNRITYNKALKIIWEEIINKRLCVTNTGLKIKDYSAHGKDITIKRKYFTKADDKYWSQYYIDRSTLNEFNVAPISMFWVDGFKAPFTYEDDGPMYAYRIFNSFKIYRPNSKTKKDKWRSNCSNTDIQGWEQLPESGDTLIITKSLKDIMVLKRFKLPSISGHSEVASIPQSVLNQAKMRFKRIVVFYDNDESGMKGAKALSDKYDLEMIYIPQHYIDIYNVKDISDYIKAFGIEKTQELINELLWNTN